MTRLVPFYSGSSGNCIFIEHQGEKLLIDAGMSCKCITEALKQVETDIEDVKGIFVTHEHIDHIKGLKIITKKYGLPIYATKPVVQYLLEKACVFEGTPLYPIEKAVSLDNMQLTAFATSHDSVGSVGYRIEMDNGLTVGIATDLGVVTEKVHQALTGCDVVVLESNYDKRMLECGRYPYPLKRRIMSEKGHLSNENCAKELEELIQSGCTQFILAHLSKENNLPQLAYQTAVNYLEQKGIREDIDFSLHIAPRSFQGKQHILCNTAL